MNMSLHQGPRTVKDYFRPVDHVPDGSNGQPVACVLVLTAVYWMILPETMVVVEVSFAGIVTDTDPSEVEMVQLGVTEGGSLTGMFQGILN